MQDTWVIEPLAMPNGRRSQWLKFMYRGYNFPQTYKAMYDSFVSRGWTFESFDTVLPPLSSALGTQFVDGNGVTWNDRFGAHWFPEGRPGYGDALAFSQAMLDALESDTWLQDLNYFTHLPLGEGAGEGITEWAYTTCLIIAKLWQLRIATVLEQCLTLDHRGRPAEGGE